MVAVVNEKNIIHFFNNPVNSAKNLKKRKARPQLRSRLVVPEGNRGLTVRTDVRGGGVGFAGDLGSRRNHAVLAAGAVFHLVDVDVAGCHPNGFLFGGGELI